MKGKDDKNRLVIYQGPAGALELKADAEKETIWATQAQIADVFGVERSVVTKHIGNIFRSREVDEKRNVQKMHIANSDKPIAFYALDIILAVGYRTNSARAMAFRQWATRTLREHILKGYTINRKRIAKNYGSFIKAVESVRALLPASSKIETADIIELIKMFAGTWFSLAAADLWRAGPLPELGGKGSASTLFYGQEPSVCRWEQAERGLCFYLVLEADWLLKPGANYPGSPNGADIAYCRKSSQR